jgi:hypothetical protein
MMEVKIREITENIVVPGLLGTQNNQLHKYDQLYFVKSGDVVPDNIYTLKQGERQEMCNVTTGRVRGAEWADRNQAMFLILGR